jgi:hypothetical protein
MVVVLVSLLGTSVYLYVDQTSRDAANAFDLIEVGDEWRARSLRLTRAGGHPADAGVRRRNGCVD